MTRRTRLALVLVLVTAQMLALFSPAIGQGEPARVPVFLDGKQIGEALLAEGRSYLPVRALAEALGLTVDWKDVERRVEVQGPAGGGRINDSLVQRIVELEQQVRRQDAQLGEFERRARTAEAAAADALAKLQAEKDRATLAEARAGSLEQRVAALEAAAADPLSQPTRPLAGRVHMLGIYQSFIFSDRNAGGQPTLVGRRSTQAIRIGEGPVEVRGNAVVAFDIYDIDPARRYMVEVAIFGPDGREMERPEGQMVSGGMNWTLVFPFSFLTTRPGAYTFVTLVEGVAQAQQRLTLTSQQ